MWANDSLVCQGDTPEKAIIDLMNICYPTIWHLNDFDEGEVGEGEFGRCAKWFNRKENKPIGAEERE